MRTQKISPLSLVLSLLVSGAGAFCFVLVVAFGLVSFGPAVGSTALAQNGMGSAPAPDAQPPQKAAEAVPSDAVPSNAAPSDAAMSKLAASDLANYGGKPLGKYAELGVRDGIYNNGQAALWDLHIVDYYRYFGPPQRARGYRPEQPIQFSHITHVQQNKMECQYCHYSVSKAAYAAIPEVETCMGCHNTLSSASLKVQGDAAKKSAEKLAEQAKEAAEKVNAAEIEKLEAEQKRLALSAAELEKLEGYWTRSEPIPWVKVHVMPDYVHFNHKRHVKAGVACQECHGQVPNMQVVERASSMKMGWCVDCHRQRGASIDCVTCHY